jgi:polyhydroxyalkanoate synthase subunit PhaC
MARSSIDPSVTRAQLLEMGEKLGAGFRHLTGSGQIEVSPTPRRLVHEQDKVKLYRYSQPDGRAMPTGTPLLIVYALVNRPYMLDLEQGRSLIANLVDEDICTYLLDWGYPDASDQFLTLEDYIFDYLDEAIGVVLDQHACDSVNLLGVCQGGVFSLCYTARHKHRVRNLITMVTPVDFQTPDNLLSRWVQALDVEKMVETLGMVPGELLNWAFLSLKPFVLGARKYLDMIDNADDAERLATFLRMEKWIHDSPDQAGTAFAQFVRYFFLENALVRENLTLDGQPLSLKDITHPVLNIVACRDHLVPPSASTPLGQLTSSTDYTLLEEDAGHIGLFVSSARSRAVATAISQWLAQRS